ncbi:MAG: hypothetical protein ACPG5B_06695 [Chitinophagales bacterium]
MTKYDFSASNLISIFIGFMLFVLILDAITFEERTKIQQNLAYKTKLTSVATELNVPVQALQEVMYFESGNDHYAENIKSGAVGSIQFLPKTLKQLGTSRDTLCEMLPIEQLDYVLKYYQQFSRTEYPINTAGDLYLLTLYPAMVRDPTRTIFATQKQRRYQQNKIFDINRNGIITRQEIVRCFSEKVKEMPNSNFKKCKHKKIANL